MKKSLSLLLSVIFLFSLTACSQFETEPPVEEKEPNKLYEADLSVLGDITIADFDIGGGYIAVLYYNYYGEDDWAKAESGEVQLDTRASLGLFDIENERLVKKNYVDDEAYCVEFRDGSIQIWRTEKGETENDDVVQLSSLYDYELNYTGEGSGKSFDCYDLANITDTISTDRFVCSRSLAYDTHYLGSRVMVFYDDKDSYYITENDNSVNIADSFGKLVLESVSSEGNGDIILNVKDYGSRKLINTLTVKSDKEFDSLAVAKLKDNGAGFFSTDDMGRADGLYFWSYTVSPLNEDVECQIVRDSDFDIEAEKIMSEIKEKYGVRVELNPENTENVYQYDFKDNRKRAQYLLCLYDLKYCLGTLPENFCTEMLCKDIENPICSFDEFVITLVGEVSDESVDAYAFNANDALYIVYGCNAFNRRNFYHELMHNAEYRIWNYEPDFDDEWLSLNPEGFAYNDDYGKTYYDNEQWQDYFTRDYSMKNSLEDRATVFEELCQSGVDKDAWWTKKEPLNKKFDLLGKIMLKSFPSLENNCLWKK